MVKVGGLGVSLQEAPPLSGDPLFLHELHDCLEVIVPSLQLFGLNVRFCRDCARTGTCFSSSKLLEVRGVLPQSARVADTFFN